MSNDENEPWNIFTNKSQLKQITEWKKLFKQDVNDKDIEDVIGKVIRAEGTITENGKIRPFGFEGLIVGFQKEAAYSLDKSDHAVRYMFHTDEGLGFRILNDMKWSILDLQTTD